MSSMYIFVFNIHYNNFIKNVISFRWLIVYWGNYFTRFSRLNEYLSISLFYLILLIHSCIEYMIGNVCILIEVFRILFWSLSCDDRRFVSISRIDIEVILKHSMIVFMIYRWIIFNLLIWVVIDIFSWSFGRCHIIAV